MVDFPSVPVYRGISRALLEKICARRKTNRCLPLSGFLLTQLLGRVLFGRPVLDSSYDRIDTSQNRFGRGGIGNFQAVVFVQRHHDLQGVDGIEANAARAEERL